MRTGTIQIRRSAERGAFVHGWLDTKHTFSFADYYDPQHMHFRALRVINEDVIAPGQGFGTHPHRDMEIITYILSGALEHRDSMGNREVLHAGEFQRITAGQGITHSEFNASATEPVHLVQIWLMPRQRGLTPGYEQRGFEAGEVLGKFRAVVTPDGRDGSLRMEQDASVWLTRLTGGQSVSHSLESDRHAWVQVLQGSVMMNGELLSEGDGAAVSNSDTVELHHADETDKIAEVIVFDLN
ncbi:MAG: pirin family protein [Pirellulales bacterium]